MSRFRVRTLSTKDYLFSARISTLGTRKPLGLRPEFRSIGNRRKWTWRSNMDLSAERLKVVAPEHRRGPAGNPPRATSPSCLNRVARQRDYPSIGTPKAKMVTSPWSAARSLRWSLFLRWKAAHQTQELEADEPAEFAPVAVEPFILAERQFHNPRDLVETWRGPWIPRIHPRSL